jgi:uncharacterized protein
MIRGRCPICSKSYAIAALADLPTFPFCSQRCRLVDLGRWIDGAYAIPDSTTPGPTEPSPADDDEIEGD